MSPIKPENRARTTFVEIKAPSWVTQEHFKKAAPILSKVMRDLREHGDDSMRGFIHHANLNGFPVKAGFADTDQLEEICIRAFWFAFERVTAG